MNSTSRIRVQIADDHDLIRRGLQASLAEAADIEVLQPLLTNGRDLLKKIDRADVLLLDIGMPEFALVPTLTQLRGRPKPRVVLITAQADHALVRSCVSLGVSGYALKEDALGDMLPAMVRRVAAGEKWFSPAVGYFLGDNPVLERLTPRQTRILQLMGAGQSPHEIAASLIIAPSSVYKVQHLLREVLGAKNNADAVRIAVQQGVLVL